MKYVKINSKNCKSLNIVAPSAITAITLDENIICYGAFDVRNEQPYILGTMVLDCSDETTFVLKWLYVDDDNRFEGTGEHLLEIAFREAKSRGARFIKADRCEEYLTPQEVEAGMYYLEAHEFVNINGIMTADSDAYERSVIEGLRIENEEIPEIFTAPDELPAGEYISYITQEF